MNTSEHITVLEPYVPPAPKRRTGKQVIYVSSLPSGFFAQSSTCWTGLDGRSRWQMEQAGTGTERLQTWLAEGARQLTGRQRLYIDAYYNQGLSMQRIAELCGVNKSSVSRGVGSGMAKLQSWLADKQLLARCTLEDGSIKWDRLLSGVGVLTGRQRQLLVLMRTGQFNSREELGSYLALDRTTVIRTVIRAVRALTRLGVPAKRLDWLHMQKLG